LRGIFKAGNVELDALRTFAVGGGFSTAFCNKIDSGDVGAEKRDVEVPCVSFYNHYRLSGHYHRAVNST